MFKNTLLFLTTLAWLLTGCGAAPVPTPLVVAEPPAGREELARHKARFGEDDPLVKALQQQLDGYRSMAASREQNFLVGTLPKPASPK